MVSSSPKRLFILGAGFSYPAGMPLATGLTDELVNAEHVRDVDEFQDWFRHLQDRIRLLNSERSMPPAVSVGIEELFDFAAIDRECWMMQQHTCPFGRDDGEPPFSRAKSISAYLKFMEDALVEVLVCKQEAANVAALDCLTSSLGNGDTVSTFNYDTMLECALTSHGKTWSHGFPTESAGDVTILKLHGSVDWWLVPRERMKPRDERRGDPKVLFEKDDANIAWEQVKDFDSLEWEYRYVLCRVGSLNQVRSYDEQYTGISPGKSPRPGLGGLGAHKPLHRLVGSGLVWATALNSMRQADEIYVIGWSASPYDSMARLLFATALNQRTNSPTRVVIVDPNVDKQISNYQAIFGKVEPVAKCLQDVDWTEVLGTR